MCVYIITFSKESVFSSFGPFSILLSSFSESRVLIQFNHFSDNLVLCTVEESVLFGQAWVVSALLDDPLLLALVQFTLESVVILANDSLDRIIVSITNIISTFRDSLLTLDIVSDQSESIRSQSLADLSVELSVFVRAVFPVFVLELQVVIEEVLSFNELPSVPFCNISSLKTEKTNKKKLEMI